MRKILLTRPLRIRENIHFVNASGKAMAFLRGNFPLYNVVCSVLWLTIQARWKGGWRVGIGERFISTIFQKTRINHAFLKLKHFTISQWVRIKQS